MIRTNSNQELLQPGSTSAPGLAFAGDQTTGLYSPSKGEIEILIKKTPIASFNNEIQLHTTTTFHALDKSTGLNSTITDQIIADSINDLITALHTGQDTNGYGANTSIGNYQITT
jgi:hypothetical protein